MVAVYNERQTRRLALVWHRPDVVANGPQARLQSPAHVGSMPALMGKTPSCP